MKNFSFIQSRFVFLFCLMTFCLFNSLEASTKSNDYGDVDTPKELTKRNLTLNSIKQVTVKRWRIKIVIQDDIVITVVIRGKERLSREEDGVIRQLQQIANKYQISSRNQQEQNLVIRTKQRLSKSDQREIDNILRGLNPKHYHVQKRW